MVSRSCPAFLRQMRGQVDKGSEAYLVIHRVSALVICSDPAQGHVLLVSRLWVGLSFFILASLLFKIYSC